MTEDKAGPEAGAALWRRARGGWLDAVGAVAAPDEMTLAAYLDGRLDEAEAAPVEAWMAATPEALSQVLALRKALAAPPADVPAHMVARARAIVRRRATARSGGAGWGARLTHGLAGLLPPAAWAGVAAALLLASVSGFELGRSGVEHLAALDQAVAQDVLLIMGRTGNDLL